MQTIQKIMVAVDQSEYSLPSVQYARDLAMALDARLILANVLNERDLETIRNTMALYNKDLWKELWEEHLDEHRKFLDALAQESGIEDILDNKIVRTGIPFRELLAVIDEEKPDLLVMGTKGRSNLADTIVGSCAQKMYRRSPIPVLSLRPEARKTGKQTDSGSDRH